MPRFLGPVVLVSLGLAAPVGAEVTPAKPATGPSVQQLVEQLGDRDYLKRDAASKALEEMGPKALPDLRKARATADPETRRRLDDLIPALETTAILAPKRVTLKMHRKTLKEITDEITRQTTYKVEFWGGNEQQLYSFQFDKATFWEAFDKVCETTGMVLQQGYGDDRLRLQAQDSITPYVFRDGPFRFQATGFQYTRNITFGTVPRTPTPQQRSEHMNFSFNVFTEPKLPLLGINEVKVTEAVDDLGNSMVPVVNNNADFNNFGMRRFYRYGSGYRTIFAQAGLNLVRASDKAKVVKVLRGNLPITLLAEQRAEVVSPEVLKAKGKKAKFGTTTISVDDVTQTPAKQYELKVSIAEEGKENDYTWMSSLYQRIEVQDAKGEKYQYYGTSMNSNGAGNAQITFTLGQPGNAKLGPPTKLIFYAWDTIQHQVSFEFRDLPLP